MHNHDVTSATSAARAATDEDSSDKQRMPRVYATSTARNSAIAAAEAAGSQKSLRQRFYWDVEADEVTFGDSHGGGSRSQLVESAEFSQMAQRETEEPFSSPVLKDVFERRPVADCNAACKRPPSRFVASRQSPFPKAVHRRFQQKQQQQQYTGSSDAACARAEDPRAAAAAVAAEAAKALGLEPDEVHQALQQLREKLGPEKFAFLHRRAGQRLQNLQEEQQQWQKQHQERRQGQKPRQQEHQQGNVGSTERVTVEDYHRYHIALQKKVPDAPAGAEASTTKNAAAANVLCCTSFVFDSREAEKLRWTDPPPQYDPISAASAATQQQEQQEKQKRFAAAAGVPLLGASWQQRQLAALRFDFKGRLRTDSFGLHAASAALVALWQRLLLPQEDGEVDAVSAAADEADVGAWLTPSDAAAVATAAAEAAAEAEDPLASYKGLHHHGSQPEAPGYTVEETLMLAHSATAAQRALAVRTLGQLALAARTLCLVPDFQAESAASAAHTDPGSPLAVLQQTLLVFEQQLQLRGGFGFGTGRFLRFLMLDEQLPFRMCGSLMAESAAVSLAAAEGLANIWLPINPTRRVGPLEKQRMLKQLQQEEQEAPDAAASAALYLSPAGINLSFALAKPLLTHLQRSESATTADAAICSCMLDMSECVAAEEEPTLYPLGGVDFVGFMHASSSLWPAAGGPAPADARVCLGPGSAWACLAARWNDLPLEETRQQQQQDFLDLPLGESFGRHSHAAAVDFVQVLPRVAVLLQRCSGIAEEEQQLLRLLCGVCSGGPAQVEQLLKQEDLVQQLLLLADGLLLGGESRQKRRAAARRQLLAAASPLINGSSTTNREAEADEADTFSLEEQRLLLQFLLLLRICAMLAVDMPQLESLFGSLEIGGSSTGSSSNSVMGLLLQSLMTVIKQPQLQVFGQLQQGRVADDESKLLDLFSVLQVGAAAAAVRVLRLLQQRSSCAAPLYPLLPAFAAHTRAFRRQLQQLQGRLQLEQLPDALAQLGLVGVQEDPTPCSFCPQHRQDKGNNTQIAEKARQLLRFEGDLVAQLLSWGEDAVSAGHLDASLLLPAAAELLDPLQKLHQLEPTACSRLSSAVWSLLMGCTNAVRWRIRDNDEPNAEALAAAAAPCDDPEAALAQAAALDSKGESFRVLLLHRWSSLMMSPLRLLLGTAAEGDDDKATTSSSSNRSGSFSIMGQWGAALSRVLLLIYGRDETTHNSLKSEACFFQSTAEANAAAGAARLAARVAAAAVSSYLTETGWTLATRCCSLSAEGSHGCQCEICNGSNKGSIKANGSSGCRRGASCSIWALPVTSESFATVSATALRAMRLAVAASLPSAADAVESMGTVGCLHDPRVVEMLLMDIHLLRCFCEAFSACIALLMDVSEECSGSGRNEGTRSNDQLVSWGAGLRLMLQRHVQRFADEATTLARGLLLLLESLHEHLRLPQRPQQMEHVQQGEQQRDFRPFVHSAVRATAPTLPQDGIAACALAALDVVRACNKYLGCMQQHEEGGSSDICGNQAQDKQVLLPLRCAFAALANAAIAQTALQAFGHVAVYLGQQMCCCHNFDSSYRERNSCCVWGAAAETLVGCSAAASWSSSAIQQLHAALRETLCSSQRQYSKDALLVTDVVQSLKRRLDEEEAHEQQRQRKQRQTKDVLSSALLVSPLDLMTGAPLWSCLLLSTSEPQAAARARAAGTLTQHVQRLLLYDSRALRSAIACLASPDYVIGGLLRCLQLQQHPQPQPTEKPQQQQERPAASPCPAAAAASDCLLQEWRLLDALLLEPLGVACAAPLAAAAAEGPSAAVAGCKEASSWNHAVRVAVAACAAAESSPAAPTAENNQPLQSSVDWLREAAAAASATGGTPMDGMHLCCCESSRSFAVRGTLQLLQQLHTSSVPGPVHLVLLLLFCCRLMPREAQEHIWGDEGAMTVLNRNSVLLLPATAAVEAASMGGNVTETWKGFLRVVGSMRWGVRTPDNEWVLCGSAAGNCLLLSLLLPPQAGVQDEAVLRLQRAFLRKQLEADGGVASAVALAAVSEEQG